MLVKVITLQDVKILPFVSIRQSVSRFHHKEIWPLPLNGAEDAKSCMKIPSAAALFLVDRIEQRDMPIESLAFVLAKPCMNSGTDRIKAWCCRPNLQDHDVAALLLLQRHGL